MLARLRSKIGIQTLEEIGRSNKHPDGAFVSALNYAREIEKQYPKSAGYTISTTGHSLGGAKSTFVAGAQWL